ncbi:MAG: NADPH-dependent F420 reductase [Anaerolineaceae bacterium]|nr:NADPH-dependent F420 reductase [Anaerolineaceae bacterium]MCY4023593.1 NADPH-dependent F420 reductase [Anaerolineaceae bacterium]
MGETGETFSIAVLGGTGAEGSGLALRWARAGYPVIIGSRVAERAETHAAALLARAAGATLRGAENRAAAEAADLVVLSVPYGAHRPTLERVRPALEGKILVDLTVPLRPPAVRRVQLPTGQAAALEAQEYLGPEVRVVAAFQNVSAEVLDDEGATVDCDVLVCGNDPAARETVVTLAAAAGMRGLHAGQLANAVAVESLTPVLLFINRRYGGRHSGVRITGLDDV